MRFHELLHYVSQILEKISQLNIGNSTVPKEDSSNVKSRSKVANTSQTLVSLLSKDPVIDDPWNQVNTGSIRGSLMYNRVYQAGTRSLILSKVSLISQVNK